MKKNNIENAKVSGGILFDPLEFYEKAGYLVDPIKKIFDEAYNSFLFTKRMLPTFAAISINGCPYHEAGSNAVSDLGFVFSKLILYLRELISRGLEIDEIAPKITLSLALGSDLFMEIAKIRATRLLWSKIIKAFDGNEQSQKVKIHSFAPGINKSSLDVYNNVLRNTSESIAGILGGSNVIHLRYFDEQFGYPADFSRRFTRNILNVLMEECNLTATVDPAGGAWYLESLTQDLAKKTYEMIQTIEAKGGFIEALIAGFPQEISQKTAGQRISNIATRKDVLLGINKYPNIYEEKPKINDLDLLSISEERKNEINDHQNKRNNEILGKLLSEYQQACQRNSDRRFELAVECIINGATLGEIAFYTNFDEYLKIDIKSFEKIRLSEPFEQIRERSISYKSRTGHFPKVFLANFGTLSQYKARVDFSSDTFLVAGFEPQAGSGYLNIDEAANAILASDAPVIVICSSDDLYPEIVPAFTKIIKDKRPALKVILAGFPVDYIEQFKAAGVHKFIHIKANIFEIMTKLQAELGIG